MAKSKVYNAAAAKVEEGKFYTPTEAVTLAKETRLEEVQLDRRGRAEARGRPAQG